METGAIVRVEELTRIPSDVQDALITILSEKSLPIPELDEEVQARKGFNVIATANNRDRGVNELSRPRSSGGSTRSSCRCPSKLDEEITIVRTAGRRARPRARAARRAAGARGDPPDRHDLPRAARRA